MKLAPRLVPAALALLTCSWALAANACDDSKSSAQASAAKATRTTAVASGSAKSYAGCTAEQAAQCTAAQAAACKAKGVSATTAASAGHAGCTAEQAAACKAKGVSATAAVASGAKGNKVFVAGSGGSCAAKNRNTTFSSGSGVCNGHGMANAAGKNFHANAADCEACADMALCGDELTAAGAHTQIVPLKNGVMFVYTADSPSQVNAVQSAMTRRSERMTQFVNAGDHAKLCAECRSMRGAMASGKLTREVVNIEGGSLTLMTSEDPAVVAKIHAMIESKGNARIKS